MPCRKISDGGQGSATATSTYATEEECLQACGDGACCETSLGMTGCTVKPKCKCTGTGKVFLGVGTTCTPNPCADPTATGACCVGNVCSTKTQAECVAAGGSWKGAGVKCTAYPCTNGCEKPDSSCECWCKYDGGTVPNYCNVTMSGWVQPFAGQPQIQVNHNLSLPLRSSAGACPNWFINDYLPGDSDYTGAASIGLRINVSGAVDLYDVPGVKKGLLASGFVKAAGGNAVAGAADNLATTKEADMVGPAAVAGVGCWRSITGKYYRDAGDQTSFPGGAAHDITVRINGFA